MTLYKKMLTFETGYFDKKKSGEIVMRFNNDADTACNGIWLPDKKTNLRIFYRIFSV